MADILAESPGFEPREVDEWAAEVRRRSKSSGAIKNPVGFLRGRLRDGAKPPSLPNSPPPPLEDTNQGRYKPSPTYREDQNSVWTTEEKKNRNAPPVAPSQEDAEEFASLKAILAKDPTVMAYRNRGKATQPPLPADTPRP